MTIIQSFEYKPSAKQIADEIANLQKSQQASLLWHLFCTYGRELNSDSISEIVDDVLNISTNDDLKCIKNSLDKLSKEIAKSTV